MQCESCDTKRFCDEIGRCLSNALYEGLGESSLQEMEDLTADDVGLKMPHQEKNVFSKPLPKDVKDIIQFAIK